MNLRTLSSLLTFGFLVACGGGGNASVSETFSDIQILGKQLFLDTNLSSPAGQSCGTCHDIGRAFTDPISERSPTSEGVVPGRFGFRNSPSLSYAAFSPVFHFSDEEQDFIGGQFLDGQAATLEEQARRPFVRSVEMNNASIEEVVEKVRAAKYAKQFQEVFGDDSLSNTETAFTHVTEAIAAYEHSGDFARFTSKYDFYLIGKADLSPQETRGLALFNDPAKGNCAACHPSESTSPGIPPLFTDFTYDNIGVARNPANPFYQLAAEFNPDGASFLDLGLQNATGRPSDAGRFKVSTLRNIADTAPYFHNGIFQTLEEVVHFYNKRDADGVVPEIADGVNREELGNLGLSEQEEKDIVAFMQTLTDGFRP